MTTYTNPFHLPNNQFSKSLLQTEAEPSEYKGYLIFERIKGSCWDIVKDSVCVGMYAGVNGAKRFVDSIEK